MTERLDGNAIAGVCAALFGRELTVATGVCGACGNAALVAELHVYVGAGYVARCPACGAVLLRIVEGPAQTWIDLGGLATLELPS
jgi:ribosomal protein S27E